MDTCTLIRLAIALGQLKPEAADLGRHIIETYGEETFHYFLLYRAIDAQQSPASLPPIVFSPVVPEHGH